MFSGLSQSQCVGEEEGANMFVDWIGGKTTFITPREETAVHKRRRSFLRRIGLRIRAPTNILRDTDPILLATIIDFHGLIFLTLSQHISDISPYKPSNETFSSKNKFS